MEEKITISLEEYKELLIIKGKYEELKAEKQTPLIWSGFNENGTTILPCKDARELQTTDPLITPPYKITCKKE